MQTVMHETRKGSSRLSWDRIRASLRYRISARSFDTFEAAKIAYHSAARSNPEAVLFIFGCQRSGTTHLERLFRADPRSVVFGEFSALSIAPDKTVWQPLADVGSRLGAARGTFAVARSLLASHRALSILDDIDASTAVWMYRRADEVVSSMLRKWSGDFEAISKRVESDHDGHWDLEELWRSVHATAQRLSAAPEGSDARLRDVYALYWHARNSTYFDLGLDEDARIRLLDYQTLLARPDESLHSLMEAAGISRPAFRFPITTSRANPRNGRKGYFSPAVESLCDKLYDRMVTTEAAGQ